VNNTSEWDETVTERVKAVVSWALVILVFYGLYEAFHHLSWLVGLLLAVIMVESWVILMQWITAHGGL
jgi:hypothetical protein